MDRPAPASPECGACPLSWLPIVFLGPSLPWVEAWRLLAADYRPPLRRGDLDALPGPALVGIVDGVLDPEARMEPEEARRAAIRGIRMFGAASFGAMLATDPSILGVVTGVGRVAGLLRHGRADPDDVALQYAAHDLRPLTVPVVDVICWMAKTFAANVLATGAANRALHGLRAVPVEDRTPALVASLLHAHLGSASPWSRGATVCGAKTGDARLLLRALRVLRRRETNGTLQVQLCSVHQSEL